MRQNLRSQPRRAGPRLRSTPVRSRGRRSRGYRGETQIAFMLTHSSGVRRGKRSTLRTRHAALGGLHSIPTASTARGAHMARPQHGNTTQPPASTFMCPPHHHTPLASTLMTTRVRHRVWFGSVFAYLQTCISLLQRRMMKLMRRLLLGRWHIEPLLPSRRKPRGRLLVAATISD